jgi:hypothetical protein
MSTYDKIAWLPLCGGVTGLGLVLSYLAMRRRGLRSGLRGAAWSLLPMAAYLTGAIEMFWKMGAAIGDFAKGFVFSDRVWSGIGLAGLSVVILVVSGGVRRRGKRGGDTRAVAPGTRTQPAAAGQNAGALGSGMLNSGALGSGALTTRSQAAAVPVAVPASQQAAGRRGAGKAAPGADADDDMQDIEDILRRRGIKLHGVRKVTLGHQAFSVCH